MGWVRCRKLSKSDAISPNIDTRSRPLLRKQVLALSSCLLKSAFKNVPSVQSLWECCLEWDPCGTWAGSTATAVAGPPRGPTAGVGVRKP